jgi:hypothetical protein
MLAMALVFGLAACPTGGGDPGDGSGDVTYTVSADGVSDTTTTTAITFVFNEAVSGLTAGDIVLGNGTGSAAKGALTGSGANWSLGLTVNTAGTVKVRINKTGIETAEKTVTVHKAVTAVTFTVTYRAGEGGSNPPASEEVSEGSQIQLPEGSGMTGPEGTVFRGWKSSVDGKRYDEMASYEVSGDVTFTAQWFESVANIQARISRASNGSSASDPFELKVTLDLADGENGWNGLLDAIAEADKFVALDLSDCVSSSDTRETFSPGSNNSPAQAKIVSLVLPDEATRIPERRAEYVSTFTGFTALTRVTGANITYIGSNAFTRCDALTAVDFPKATEIYSAFSGCTTLTTVNLPEVVTIGSSSFEGCTALTTVSLPKAVNISRSIFEGCTALTTVSLPELVTIGSSSFKDCTALTTVNLPKAVNIEESTFQGCTGLTTASLPEAETIGRVAFYWCTSLTTVSLPKVRSIHDDLAFSGCTSLTTVDLPEAVTIGKSTFQGCAALTTVSLPKVVTITETTFEECAGLTTVNLPEAETIGPSAFSYCTALTTVSLPEAETIDRIAFSYCTALTTVSLPKVETIGRIAFSYCTALTTVSLPEVKSIQEEVFFGTGTTSLTVTLGNTVPMLGPSMFAAVSSPKTVTVKVPSGAAAWNGQTGTFTGTSDSGDTSSAKWGNGFRGGGWTPSGNYFTPASDVNSFISLTIQGEGSGT